MKQIRVGCVPGLLAGLVLLTAAPALSWAGCDGVKSTETYDAEEAHSLSVSGDADVLISQGTVPGLRIEARAGVLEDLEVSFSSGRLEIEPDDCDDDNYRVHVTMTDIKTLKFRGSTRANSQTPLHGDRIELITSGSSDVNLEISAGQLVIDSSGSSDLALSGTAGKVSVDTSGSTKLEAKALVAEEYEIDASGSSKLNIHVRDGLKADLSGSSKIGYLGTPRVNIEASGSSKVTAL